MGYLVHNHRPVQRVERVKNMVKESLSQSKQISFTEISQVNNISKACENPGFQTNLVQFSPYQRLTKLSEKLFVSGFSSSQRGLKKCDLV